MKIKVFYIKCEVVTASDMTTNIKQIKVIGVTKDIENNEKANATTYAANVNVIGIINEHNLKTTSGI